MTPSEYKWLFVGLVLLVILSTGLLVWIFLAKEKARKQELPRGGNITFELPQEIDAVYRDETGHVQLVEFKTGRRGPGPQQLDYYTSLMARPMRATAGEFQWPVWEDHHIDPSQDPYHGTRKDWRAEA